MRDLKNKVDLIYSLLHDIETENSVSDETFYNYVQPMQDKAIGLLRKIEEE
ncbi:hypothetical protein [Brassicibacter mesophilus]|uniref:hypothetical protein n=1 Tax=Brassicibacter mesophilus TaxID=745119 RepID=UPI003D2517B0